MKFFDRNHPTLKYHPDKNQSQHSYSYLSANLAVLIYFKVHMYVPYVIYGKKNNGQYKKKNKQKKM